MKKIILVLSTILIVFSCSKSDDGTDTGQNESAIFGKWYLVETPDIVYHLRRAKVSIAGR
jgi:hypothetical protein